VSVKVTKVACQSCGANLTLDDSIRFVTCGYCSAQLEIVHDSSTIHSKILEDIVKRQNAVEAELNILRIEREIRRIERGWESYRQNLSSRAKDGSLVEPSTIGPTLVWAFGWIIGLIIIIASGSNQQWFGLVLGLAILLTSYLIADHGIRRAKEFAAMRSRYLIKLNHLKGDLSSAERKLRLAPMKRSGASKIP